MPSTSPEDRAAVWEAPLGVEQVMEPVYYNEIFVQFPQSLPSQVSAFPFPPSFRTLLFPQSLPPESPPSPVPQSPPSPSLCFPCSPKSTPSPVAPSVHPPLIPLYSPPSICTPPEFLPSPLHPVSGHPISTLSPVPSVWWVVERLLIHSRVLTLLTTHCVFLRLEFKVKLNIHLPYGDAP